MKKENKKRSKLFIALCVCMIVAAVALAIATDGILTGAHTTMWQRLLFINAIIGTGIAGLLGLFAGYKGLLYGYSFTLMLSAASFIPTLIPEKSKGWFAVLFFAVILLLPHIKNLIRKTRAVRSGDEAEADEDELTDEEKAELEKFSNLKIAAQQGTGRFYQLIVRDGRLYAYHVGTEFKGILPEKIQDEAAELRAPEKKDRCIDLRDIKSVTVYESISGHPGSIAFVNAKGLAIRFSAVTLDYEEYCDFWKELVPDKVIFPDEEAAEKERSEKNYRDPDEKRLAILKTVRTVIIVFTAAVALLWLFIDVPYRLFSVLAMLPLPVLLALYISFPNELTLLEKPKTGDTVNKLSLSGPVTMSGIIPALRTLLDFNFTDGWSVFLSGLLVAAAVLLLLLLLTREWKTRKIVIMYFVMALLFYVPGALGQINYILDNSVPSVTQGEIIDMHISTSRRAPDSHYLRVRTEPDGETVELRVGKRQYFALSEGEDVEIYTFSGALGFSYSYAV